ncbi:hypothetical protein K435DRAFT_651821 [Dendrothele bispora CBS 962.96]|uniref:Uncharacterized protein n=1 Tax=Dendrothele bispora (strain CBS 962.96) TaxID=1314807 RepID=A0A4S8MKB5_DENBC|nr:hypothetical protein K435DRAFT_651821 [Dendrothele bispora CBS 962.96]
MKFLVATTTVASLLPTIFGLTINTPTGIVQCQPSLLSWSDGTAPYFLSILPGGQAAATPLKSFDSTDSTSITWTVDIAGGTSITLQIRDSTGTIAFSDAVNIQSSSDSSCVSSSTVASGSTGAAASTGTGASSGTSTGTTSRTTGSSSGSSSASSAPASASSNAASHQVVSYGLAGIAGFLGIAAAI